MADEIWNYDYHGALVVVEIDDDCIVFIHPPGAEPQAPASLPSDPCGPDETPEEGAVRIVREKTGLEVRIARELTNFLQEGTPTGTMCAHGFAPQVIGGNLREDGPEGPGTAYPVTALPAIIPVGAAKQRALRAYLDQRTPLTPRRVAGSTTRPYSELARELG